MTRRQFLKWLFAALGATGMGVVIGRNFRTICPVTLVNVPDYSRDFSKDVAKVLLEDGMIIKGKKVLLKPNFVEFHPGRPINTDIAFIRNIAEACLSLGAADVVVGEAAGHRRDPAFSAYHPLLRKALDERVRCIDMNHCDAVKIPNKGGYSDVSAFYLASPVAQADVVINLPKMKTHHWMGVTLSMKNLFGVLPGIIYGWPKNPLHIKGIGKSILDLTLSVPVHYVIVDAIVGMEGDGPILGNSKPVGTIIMGKHPLAVDCTATRIMGFDPYNIPYLIYGGRNLPGLAEKNITYPREHPQRYATKFACLPKFENLKGGPFW